MDVQERRTAIVNDVPGAARQPRPAGQHLPQMPDVLLTELEVQNAELRLTLSRTNALLSRYFRFYDMAPVAFCAVSDAGLVLQANLAAGTLLGLERNFLLQQSFTKFIHPDSLNTYHLARQSLKVDAGPQCCELKIVRKSDPFFWASLEMAIVTDETGEARQYIVMTNITQRKRQESIQSARLRLLEFASKHTLKELLVATLDEVGLLTDSPIGFYHFLEKDQKTLSLQAWSTRTAQEYCKAVGEGAHYHIDEAGVWVECVRLRRPVIHNDYESLPNKRGLPPGHAKLIREMVVPVFRDGSIVAILGVGNKAEPYHSDDQSLVAMLADLAWEFADSKRVSERLLANEERWKFALDGLGVAVWDWNIESGKVTASEQWKAMLGYAGDQIRDDFDDWKKLIHPDDLSRTFAWIQTLLTTQDSDCFVEYRLRCRDGSWKWILTRGMIFARSPEGKPLRVVGTNADISARKEAEMRVA